MSWTDHKIVRNSIFLKIEQGTPHTIRILDANPTEQWQHNIENKLVSCNGEICSHCNEGHSKSQRFVTNVFDHNEQRVMLWSFGPSVATSLKNLAISLQKDDENIMAHDLEISVSGSGLQKKTSVQLRLKSSPVPEGVKLHQIKTGNEIPF